MLILDGRVDERINMLMDISDRTMEARMDGYGGRKGSMNRQPYPPVQLRYM